MRARVRRSRASWSKDQILEAYLNLAGFAARRRASAPLRLGCSARPRRRSTRDDAAAARRRCCPIRARRSTEVARARLPRCSHDEDCSRFAGAAASMRSARAQPARSIRGSRRTLPAHAARQARRARSPRRSTRGSSAVAIAALRQQCQGSAARRARDGAVVVVDNASGDVLAYVGGIGWREHRGGGRRRLGAIARRDRRSSRSSTPRRSRSGYLTAASILDDSPVQLDTASGLYVPQQLRQCLQGPGLGAHRAAPARSTCPRCAPCCSTGVRAVPRPAMGHRLSTGWSRTAYYGYSLALGSAEVTLLEQVTAFRTPRQAAGAGRRCG